MPGHLLNNPREIVDPARFQTVGRTRYLSTTSKRSIDVLSNTIYKLYKAAQPCVLRLILNSDGDALPSAEGDTVLSNAVLSRRGFLDKSNKARGRGK